MSNNSFREQLRSVGFRATPARIGVLAFLSEKPHPVGIEKIREAFPDVNQVTLYRMMTSFVEKGLVNTCDLGHGHVDYELERGSHHHHAVCEGCGLIEEIDSCQNECEIQKTFEQSASKFARIHLPQTTVFGTCQTCDAS